MTRMTPLRQAALSGLAFAAFTVKRFGWAPAGPDTHLDLWSHLKAAAGKTGPENGEHPQDVRGLMGRMIKLHLGVRLFDWEAEPGRTSDDVRLALLAARKDTSDR